MMYESILVPTDDSDCAERAVDTAIALASRFDATIHAVHVLDLADVPESVESDIGSVYTEHGETLLKSIRERAASAGVEVITEVVKSTQSIHGAILTYAEKHHSDLIVMGSHGRTGLERLVLGSIAARTIRNAPIPVLTVKRKMLNEDPTRVLVPTDGSNGAIAAAGHAIDLAGEMNAAIHVVNVVDVAVLGGEFDGAQIYEEFERIGREAVDEVVNRAKKAGIESVEVSVLTGRPGRSITEYATDRDVDLIVIGTHGKSGLDRWVLGSVAEHVVRTADAPVLTINVKAAAERE